MNWFTLVLLAIGGAIGFWGSMKKDVPIANILVAPFIVLMFALAVGALIFYSVTGPFFALAGGMVLGDYIGNDIRKRKELRTQRPQFRFCPNCCAALREREIGGKKKIACPRCQFVFWNNPIPVACVLVPSLDGKGLVLVRRSIPPKVGFFALPGGFLEPGEDPAAGAIREVKEETGLDVGIDRLLRMTTVPHVNEILIFYLAKPTAQAPTTSEEVSEAAFFPWDKLPDNIAFPIHKAVIDAWIEETIEPAIAK